MKLRLALAALSVAALASAAHAAPLNGSTSAEVSIVAPNQVSTARSLAFGSIAKPTSGTTTVKVVSAEAPAATPNLTGGNGFIPTPGQAHAAVFRIRGTPGQPYSVGTPTLDFPGAGTNLTVVGAEAVAAAGGVLGTLPNSGEDDLYIGGHFAIGPSTAVQTYTGTLAVTVDFN